MWSKLENGDLFGFAVAIVMILAVIAGIMWGIQYVGPIATVVTVLILVLQAEIMRQNMILSLKKEHTAQLHYKAIEPLIEIFSRLKMENNKLRVETPKESEIIVDASSLLNGNLDNNEESWRLRFIAFATSVNPNLDIYLLYDLVKYHIPEGIIKHFKELVLATARGDESSFNEHLNKIKEILNAFRTVIVLSDECPYIKGATNKNEISMLIEQVQKLKENIKIETKKREIFHY